MALRQKLGPDDLIIVTIVSNQNIEQENWKPIAANASFIADMCYDFHSAFYPPYYTAHNSNLYPDPNEPVTKNYNHLSCDQSIKNLILLGVPSQKIILGYPSFGNSYRRGAVPK